MFLTNQGHWLPLVFALAMPTCYELGWRTPFKIKGFAEGGTEWGEVYFGAVLYGAVVMM
jgi:hypothetical protein